MKKKITDLVDSKILILDGAMGTMIQKHKLQENDYRGERFKDHPKLQKGNNDLLSLTKPDIIKEIHRQYLEAGADIITTNTFNSNRISMSDYGMEDLVYDMNLAVGKACSLRQFQNLKKFSRTAGHFIAGTLGPTNRTASMSSDVNDPGARAVTFRSAC